MNISTNIPIPAVLTAQTRFEHQRAAIDLIAATRGDTIRVTLFANYMLRPYGSESDRPQLKAEWLKELVQMKSELDRMQNILEGRDPLGTLHRDVLAWVGTHSASHGDLFAAFQKNHALINDIVAAAQADDAAALERAIVAHETFARDSFSGAVKGFCDVLWADLDATRQDETDKAAATTDTIAKTLKRLEHIGKHVRLVSLNASVEAARVGDAGRGLGVIAVEFKTLAEEIQHLTVTARTEITADASQSEPAANQA